FSVSFTPAAPAIHKGGSTSISIAAERHDGYAGPIQLRFTQLPAGLSAPATALDAETFTTALPLYADRAAVLPEKAPPLTLVAEALIDGKKVVKEVRGQLPKLEEPGDLVTTTGQAEVALKPGGQATLTV